MKEQVTDREGEHRKSRFPAFAGRFFLVFVGAVAVFVLALSLLKDTKAYLEERRIPVMLPTGGAKF